MATGAQAWAVANRRGAATRTAALYLALFLALLVFFIFLLSRTSFDPARSVAVIEGVEARFSAVAGAALADARPQPAVFGAARAGLVPDAGLAAGLVAALSGLEGGGALAETGGPVQVARIAPSALFLGESSAFTAAGREAMAALARLIGAPAPGTRRALSVRLSAPGELALQRAGSLGALVAAIAGPDAVSVLAQDGPPALEIDLYAVAADGAEGGRS